jgi:conjugal transfer/type IV secretion protein DotA/TraY
MFPQPSGNIFVDAVSAVFGLDGLMSLADPANQNIHPLALLSAVGKSLIDSAIMNMGASLTSGIGGGLAAIMQHQMAGKLAMAASSFFASIAQIGLMAGFILYYVLPFLPFIHFFFAVGGWVKAIFEAMVGVPLWALAHLRIDGNGLPGDAALAGYFMIFEIFLRPILCIFGLIAAITIYAAQVRVLNEIWQLVTSNLTGFDRGMAVSGAPVGAGLTGSIEFLRSKADQFFFTIIYAIIVYMLGISSFKLITQIPDKIMRWIGQNIDAFVDQSGDPTENMMSYVSMGAGQVRGAIGGAMKQGAQGAQGALSALGSRQQG